MCKHVAAALYGVGARLDEKPELLFVLRGVDENELIAGAAQDVSLSKATPGAAKVLDDRDVAALFGLEMAEAAGSDIGAVPEPPKRSRTVKTVKGGKTSAEKMPRPKQHKSLRASRSKPEAQWVSPVRDRKQRAHRRPDHVA